MKIRPCAALFVRLPSNDLVLLGGPPSWDLDKVLRRLMSSVYEPLESQGLRILTKKILFLVALATAKRVSELQALSRVVPSSGDDLVLSYLPFFVAKTESPSNPLPRSFRLKALSDFADGLEEVSHLCPVRALRIYLRKTKGLARRSSALFVSPRVPSRDISKNALSFFLRDVITGAGAADVVSESSVRAHSIRGVATSVAFCETGRSPRCWRPQLGVPTLFSLPFILRMFRTFLRAFGPWVPSWQLGQCCLLDRFLVVSFLFFVGVSFFLFSN